MAAGWTRRWRGSPVRGFPATSSPPRSSRLARAARLHRAPDRGRAAHGRSTSSGRSPTCWPQPAARAHDAPGSRRRSICCGRPTSSGSRGPTRRRGAQRRLLPRRPPRGRRARRARGARGRAAPLGVELPPDARGRSRSAAGSAATATATRTSRPDSTRACSRSSPSTAPRDCDRLVNVLRRDLSARDADRAASRRSCAARWRTTWTRCPRSSRATGG